jgi:MFS family permease
MSRMNPTSKRLLPLYLGVLFQGIIFWYAIEKLFMTKIGFNDLSIGIMVAAYSLVMVITETPSGILADRWSRKGVLIISSVVLGISAIIGALSHNVPTYVIATLFWGLYAALTSGTYDSIIYDVLVEDKGNADEYETYYGRHKVFEGIAFVIGSLFAGIIAQFAGLRATYWFSLPFIAISIVFLVLFKDPIIHKAEGLVPIKKHISQTLDSVLKNSSLVLVIVALVALMVVNTAIYEFSQLWFIAVAAPLIIFGPGNALVVSSWSLGGLFSKYVKGSRRILLICTVMLIASISLSLTHLIWFIIAAQTILSIGIVSLSVVLTHQLHDKLPSRVRAGASSAVSTFSVIIIIPLAIVFGFLATQHTIFVANILLIAAISIAVGAIVLRMNVLRKKLL